MSSRQGTKKQQESKAFVKFSHVSYFEQVITETRSNNNHLAIVHIFGNPNINIIINPLALALNLTIRVYDAFRCFDLSPGYIDIFLNKIIQHNFFYSSPEIFMQLPNIVLLEKIIYKNLIFQGMLRITNPVS